MPEKSSTRSRFASCLIIGAISVMLIGALVVVNYLTRPSSQPLPKDNGWDYFSRAGELIQNVHHLGPVSCSSRTPSQWTTAEMKSFVDDNAQALAMIREGLTKDFRQPPLRSPSGIPIEQYARHRELARTLLSESMYYERIGDWPKAVRSHLDCIEFGAIYPKGGAILAGLVGVAIQAIGTQDIGKSLPHLNSAELASAARRLEHIQRRRAHFAGVLMEEANYPGRQLPLPTKIIYGARYGSVPAFYRRLVTELSGPYTATQAALPAPLNPITRPMFPVALRAKKSFAQAEAKLDILQLDIALRRHNLDTSRYPAKLFDLTPGYLKKIPVDPFGGKALKYKATNGGRDFLLYSIGPDLKDNGGKPIPKNSPASPGDIVAGDY